MPFLESDHLHHPPTPATPRAGLCTKTDKFLLMKSTAAIVLWSGFTFFQSNYLTIYPLFSRAGNSLHKRSDSSIMVELHKPAEHA